MTRIFTLAAVAALALSSVAMANPSLNRAPFVAWHQPKAETSYALTGQAQPVQYRWDAKSVIGPHGQMTLTSERVIAD